MFLERLCRNLQVKGGSNFIRQSIQKFCPVHSHALRQDVRTDNRSLFVKKIESAPGMEKVRGSKRHLREKTERHETI